MSDVFRPDRDRLNYRPTYLADRVLVGIVVGGISLAAVIAAIHFAL